MQTPCRMFGVSADCSADAAADVPQGSRAGLWFNFKQMCHPCGGRAGWGDASKAHEEFLHFTFSGGSCEGTAPVINPKLRFPFGVSAVPR